jgi:hypothetical protein
MAGPSDHSVADWMVCGDILPDPAFIKQLIRWFFIGTVFKV